MHHRIAIVNRSKLADGYVKEIAQAVDHQVKKDFTPVWGTGALISFSNSESRPLPGRFWVVMHESSDKAIDDGYHDLTPEGLAMGKVFGHDEHISIEVSHQILEMLVDPYLTWIVQADKAFYACDICDPCRGESYAYMCDDIAVSNFVHPSFFNETAADVQFDRQNQIEQPFQILPGGCIGVWAPNDGWQVLGASQMSLEGRPRVGSRRERRRTPKDQWMRSSVKTDFPQNEQMVS